MDKSTEKDIVLAEMPEQLASATNNFDTLSFVKISPWPGSLSNLSFGRNILISSAQFATSKLMMINGCEFDVVINDDRVIYLSTDDKKFRTKEGYRVGTRFSELPFDIRSRVVYEPGWAYVCPLSSGWSLAFFEPTSGGIPNSNSEVGWIFRR